MVPRSKTARATTNPIRNIVDRLQVPCNPERQPTLALNLGDPALYGNLPPPTELIEALAQAVATDSGRYVPDEKETSPGIASNGGSLLGKIPMGSSPHGYPPAVGTMAARAAVAQHASRSGLVYSAQDVIVCSGCSGALDMAITVLADGGNNSSPILLPQPGFTLYRTLCDSKGIPSVYYPLLPGSDWEVDLEAADHLLRGLREEGRAAAGWIVNNPSNPCGSVYSQEHLQAIKRLALYHGVPIIADEVYEDLVFAPNQYHPLAALEPVSVPVITCGGTAKRFLVPGWRLGWLLLAPNCGPALDEVRKGVADLACLLLGANSVIQAALPAILQDVPRSYHESVNAYMARNAQILYEALAPTENGNDKDNMAPLPITINRPQGAMYVLVGLPQGHFDFADDVAASELLISEESVKVLPGTIFGIPHYIRIVISPPPEVIREAAQRILHFCQRHMLQTLA